MRTLFIEDKAEIEEVIKECRTCFLGMVDAENKPYVIPMNFGIKDDEIYLHSGQFGRKWDILKSNPNVCITFSLGEEMAYQDEHIGCSWRVKAKSVIIEGQIEFVEDFDKKEEALHILMGQYSDRDFKFNAPAVKNVGVMKVKMDKLKAKEFGAKAVTAWQS